MRKIQFVWIALAVLLLSAFKSDRVITVYMIGDSTMANKSLEGGNQERGWGHVLGGFFTEDVRVENHAVNGRSSKSFIDEGRWETVVNKIRPVIMSLFSLDITTRSRTLNGILIRGRLSMRTCGSLCAKRVRRAVFPFCLIQSYAGILV